MLKLQTMPWTRRSSERAFRAVMTEADMENCLQTANGPQLRQLCHDRNEQLADFPAYSKRCLKMQDGPLSLN
ncbi:MAG: hypothetical protein CL868_00030 [Cytophagaceae bacterium]|nr:hypothetical protein [Henriciella sp.]MAZ25457.1 hypothetical protein [Cytophagaceae bacterium]